VRCEEVAPLLSAHVDRELDILKSLEIDSHLEVCPSCATARDELVALSRSLRNPLLREALPPHIRQRVRHALRREAGPRRLSVASWGLGAAAVLLIAFFVGARAFQGSAGTLPSELVSGHLRSLLPDRLVDVESSDRHTVKPFFHGRLDFAPPVPDLEASGFSLVGGRVEVIATRRVAVLVYRRRQHVVNVFVWPASGERLPRSPLLLQGYTVLGFERDGFVFWAVSDLDPAELGRLPEFVDAARGSPNR
jgi:anti-sigma factor RsiW